MNYYALCTQVFAVPFKCGYTLFASAAERGIVRPVTPELSDPVTCVVRDPLLRFLSFVKDKLRQAPDYQPCQRWLMDMLNRDLPPSPLLSITADDLATLLDTLPPESWDPHLRPYSIDLAGHTNITGLLNVNMPEDSAYLFNLLSQNTNAYRDYNKTIAPRPHLSESGTLLVRQLYAQDYAFISRF